MGGGAWPFLIGGAICLVNSVNERDLSLLTSYSEIIAIVGLKRGIPMFGSRRRGRFGAGDVARSPLNLII
ncbi:hypothetical protein M5689_000885 [Euphorbia peplus]|nr:hypothetical protein M5689_000885 [Euphorbia peplus]